MVLRRFREHVIDHNWFAVGVDLAIVIVGVFLGMQATSWNQERTDFDEARTFRRAIVADLRANEVDIVTRAAYYRAVRAHALAALDVLEYRPNAAGESFLVDAYQASSSWRRPLIRSSYDEMIGSGLGKSALGLQTRAQMSSYYAQIPQFNDNVLAITAYKERLRRAMPYDVQQRIGSRCRDQIRTLPSGMQIATLPTHCQPQLAPRQIVLGVARLRATSELNLDLTRLVADLDQKLALFNRYSELARDLRTDLESDA